MTPVALFAIPAIVGAFATWAGHTRLRGAFVIKALFPVTLLVLAAASLPASPRPILSLAVAAGLLFCLPADALLGLPDNRRVFVFGLGGFLLAYLLYGAGLLAASVSWAAAGLAGVVLAAAGVAQYRGFTGLDRALRGPVVLPRRRACSWPQGRCSSSCPTLSSGATSLASRCATASLSSSRLATRPALSLYLA
jgi:uncharacterized membrane protein YhhN